MVGKIEGKEYPLKDIFCRNFNFTIPNFQRPYSWSEEQTSELFDDLFEFFKLNLQDSNDSYFLGSIVLVKDGSTTSVDIVDGQQRLTTLTMLFAAIANELPNNKKEKFKTRYIWEEGNEFEGIESSPRLTLRERDCNFFKDYVQNLKFSDLEQIGDHSPIINNEAKKNIRKNSLKLLKLVREKFNGDASKLSKFGQVLVQHCYLVAVTATDQETAFRVFSILNDRGLNLKQTDILKAHIIGKISDKNRDHYSREWENYEDSIGRDNFDELIGHIRMIYVKKKAQRKIILDAREFVFTKEPNNEKLLDNLIFPYADAFRVAKNCNYSSVRNTETINNLLKSMNRINNSDWLPPVILFLTKFANIGEENIELFLTKIERLSSYMYICGRGVNFRIERYAEIISSLEKDEYSINSINGLELSTSEKKMMKKILQGPIYEDLSGHCRNYILLRLNSFLSDESARYNFSTLTIEHVLPQNVEKGSEWDKNWTEKERNIWVHRIANLVPLSQGRNIKAQNFDFAKKKEHYFGGKKGLPSFILTNQLRDMKTWLPSDLKERQDSLLQVLFEKWDL